MAAPASLRDQTVLLTGATGGIGQAIARALAARGARLVVTGRRIELLEPLAREVGGTAVPADLDHAAAIEALLKAAGHVDILVANAGLPGSGELTDFSIAEIDRTLGVNLRAPILLSRALVPAMVSRGRGHLVFMSSLAGKVAPAGASLYSATKFGLRGFALALRGDLRPHGVGVSVVYPGFIRDAGMFAEADVELPKGVGTRTPEDVARAVVTAIERNRAEVDVAPLGMRLGGALGGLAPEATAALSRRFGSADLAAKLAAGQRSKR